MALPGVKITIGGRGAIALCHLVLDVNGTLARDGVLEPGVPERIARLRELVEVHLLTADTHGRQAAIDADLGLSARRIAPGDEPAQKERYVRGLTGQVVAVGNGANDAAMLRAAKIGVCVLGAEGLCVEALLAAQIVVQRGVDALDLLLLPDRLRATLRR